MDRDRWSYQLVDYWESATYFGSRDAAADVAEHLRRVVGANARVIPACDEPDKYLVRIGVGEEGRGYVRVNHIEPVTAPVTRTIVSAIVFGAVVGTLVGLLLL